MKVKDQEKESVIADGKGLWKDDSEQQGDSTFARTACSR